MIYLRMTDLLLSPPVTHTYTDWQVATDLQFNNILVQSLGDTTNLTSILFNNSLDPTIKYYARSRALLSTGYTAWSNIDIFSPQNIPDNTINAPLPSLVELPTITITNNGDHVPIFGTTITISPVSTLGGAKHKSTSYILEDIDGVLIWESLYNINDMNRKVIPPFLMNPNTLYRIKIIINTDSNDTSQVLTKTIITANRTHGLIISNLENSPSTADLFIDINSTTSITKVVASLYSIINNQYTLVKTYAGNNQPAHLVTIPAIDLRPNSKYILRVVTNDPNIWDQRTFNTI